MEDDDACTRHGTWQDDARRTTQLPWQEDGLAAAEACVPAGEETGQAAMLLACFYFPFPGTEIAWEGVERRLPVWRSRERMHGPGDMNKGPGHPSKSGRLSRGPLYCVRLGSGGVDAV